MAAAGLRLMPYYLGRKAVLERSNAIVVKDKYTNEPAYAVSAASKEVISDAIGRAVASQESLQKMTNYERKEVLLSMAKQIGERREELASILATEVGKTITDARGEVGRAIDTFTIAAEESVRKIGEYQMADISARNAGYSTIVSRFPVGLVSMIVPFNFPINLAAHKIAPAIAVGCPFVLKPSDRTPGSASLLGSMLSQTSLPSDSYAVLPAHLQDAPRFSEDPRIALVSFTGSAKVGWALKKSAGKARVSLELGGNAACIVDASADVEVAIARLSFGAFYGNGQSCISVQRVFIHDAVYDRVVQGLVKKAATWTMGDPKDEKTLLGPLIAESEAQRLESWIAEAKKAGAKVLAGGRRNGAFLEATVLEDVPASCRIDCEEAFGPVCLVSRFSDIKEAIAKVNASPYGLQAGLFTAELRKAFYAFENLHTGGVVINDVPSARIDSMPYGGVKDSGLGREGVRSTMEDFTEPRVLLMKDNARL